MLSIIVPVFNEAENMPLFIERVRNVLEKQRLEYELILVDDGSKDQTFDFIKTEAAKDPRIKGIRFRRNNGQTAAIKAGIEAARGDVCITMDGDLQHDPEDIPKFINKLNEGYDLVCSYRFQRNDAFMRRFPSKIANLIGRRISKLDLKDFGSTFRAYKTDLAKEIPIYGEMHRFIPIFVGTLTDSITEIPISLQPRLHGQSKYGIDRTFRVLSDLLFLVFFASFFNRPIHIFGYIAIGLGTPGLLILGWLSVSKIMGYIEIMNYGPLFMLGVMLCLVAGQIFVIGVVCEYLVRIYYNDNRKPYSISEITFDPDAHE